MIHLVKGTYGEAGYDLVGDEKEAQGVRRALAEIALATFDEDSSAIFAIDLLGTSDMRHVELSRLALSLSDVDYRYSLQSQRQKQILTACRQGQASITQLQEMIDAFDLLDITNLFLDEEGRVGELLSSGDLSPRVIDNSEGKDFFGPEDAEYQIAAGYDFCWVYQHELVRDRRGIVNIPRLLSDRQHITCGKIKENGSFEGIETILSEDHPARMAKTDEEHKSE